MTRSELLESRGGLEGDGAGDLVGPAHDYGNGRAVFVAKPAPKERLPSLVCALEGCTEPVSVGRGAKYCSEAHRRRASHQRAQAKDGIISHSVISAVNRGERDGDIASPFERLAAVASWLPPGWRLEASSSMVTVTWVP
jgi:hypothetical protein